MQEKKKKTKFDKRFFVVFGILALLIATLVFLVFNKKETRISKNGVNYTISALHCVSKNPENPFFVSDRALGESHEIKMTFSNNIIDKLSYHYEGIFVNETDADTAHSELHAKYNIYMGDNGVSQESLYPTFTFNSSKAMINLFATKEDSLNSTTARFFFLDSDEFNGFNSYSESSLEKLYTDKGFSCKFDS